MIWAEIYLGGYTDPHVIQGEILIGVRYRGEILDRYIHPYITVIGNELILMDDNPKEYLAWEDGGIAVAYDVLNVIKYLKLPKLVVEKEKYTALCLATITYSSQKHNLLVVWLSYSSFTFLCVQGEESAVGQTLAQACKEGVARGLPPGVTLGGQPLCGSSIVNQRFLMPDAYQRAEC
ncbi:hypothetical protein TNCV_4047661 [Trichonephila clavipes]|nr:hypothetical protein TNCV_4047661 [Trichonephila clavipes]